MRFTSSQQKPEILNNELTKAMEQLTKYFNGQLDQFDLNLKPMVTEFQQKVLNVVLSIPYGRTMTYGQVAEQLGDKSLAVAVGAANAANPILIAIPCHRVLGHGNSLTGYAGGLQRKRALLELEGSLKQLSLW